MLGEKNAVQEKGSFPQPVRPWRFADELLVFPGTPFVTVVRLNTMKSVLLLKAHLVSSFEDGASSREKCKYSKENPCLMTNPPPFCPSTLAEVKLCQCTT